MNAEMIAALRELEREKGIAFETILVRSLFPLDPHGLNRKLHHFARGRRVFTEVP